MKASGCEVAENVRCQRSGSVAAVMEYAHTCYLLPDEISHRLSVLLNPPHPPHDEILTPLLGVSLFSTLRCL